MGPGNRSPALMLLRGAMKHLPLRECGLAVLLLLVLIGFYVGGYYLLMTRVGYFLPDMSTEAGAVRFGGEIFAPMHWIDVRLRPGRWNGFSYDRCGGEAPPHMW